MIAEPFPLLRTRTFFNMFILRDLLLVVVPLVHAQSSSKAVQIEAIVAHFRGSGLVPSFLPAFSPTALLAVSYKGVGSVPPGQALTRDQVIVEPNLTVIPANSSIMLGGKCTLLMADAGPPGTDETKGQRRHWLVNGATISGGNVSMVGSTVVTRYIPPNPPAQSGPHRYVFLLYNQPGEFLPPSSLAKSNVGGGIMNVEHYVNSSKLGPLIAGNYFTVQDGLTASFPIPPTTEVASATLPGWDAKTTAGKAGSDTTKANTGLIATANSLAVFLAPIFGFLAL
ncbi:phosphatidylethanolamine-binding protein [Phlebopus sp. FC_14]|nr:phosphatidylethanolamine-binding protein [Phlebopus sp. FC_14]